MGLFISKIVYRLVVHFYHFFIGLFSLFNEKAYQFSKGRINQQVERQITPTIWFHCASLGEFEQAKPLMKWFYDNHDAPIILTFFSPSGYTYKNNYPLAKAVYYLPKDSPSNAQAFIDKINPKAAFFIKYEFWFFYLHELKNQDIPHFLVAGIFRKNQIFFKPYGILHRSMLSSFNHLFVQGENSLQLLKKNDFHRASVALDTRFDTVKQISQLNFTDDIIENFIKKGKVIVIGSSWLKDELIIKQIVDSLPSYRFIIAPHEVNPQRVKQLLKLFPTAILLSNPIMDGHHNVLIVDSIGKLALLYRYADICYIGGGFGVSVHNVLEAAVYGKALIYGPRYSKSKEAVELIQKGAAICINNAEDFKKTLLTYENTNSYQNACNVAFEYVNIRAGGTLAVIEKLKKDKIF